jgi:hypothetical protein
MIPLLLSLIQDAPADPGVAAATRITEPVRLDGLLTEPFWRRTLPLTGFRQRQPDSGRPASDSTEVRIVYDDETLIIGIVAYAPSGVTARVLQRDRLLGGDGFGGIAFGGDDAVAILLDTFDDHRNAFVFATNPNGAEFDALLSDEGRDFNVDWRGVWSVHAARFSGGWSVELAIPFRTLRYAPGKGPRTWGVNAARMIRSRNEESLWRAWGRDEGLQRVSLAGQLGGLAALPQSGFALDLKPYVLTSGTQQPSHEVGRAKIGLDAKWEVRPGLTLDVTTNTDFAQVEVDSQQVNLSRFDLFFPEKRDFFLENSGVFHFGMRAFFEPPPLLLFFSRRIGVSDSGEVPLLGGARVTGRLGHETIGLLDAITDARIGQAGSNYAVARLKHDVGAAGYLGGIVTDVRRAGGSANTAGGVDALLWLTPQLNVQGFVAGSQTSGPGGDGAAYRVGLRYQGDLAGLSTFTYGITPGMQVDAGFMTRADVRRFQTFARLSPRPRALGLREMNLFWEVNSTTRWNYEPQEWWTGPYLDLNWRSGESVGLYYLTGRERLDSAFDLSDRVTVDPGSYHYEEVGMSAASASSRPVQLSLNGNVRRLYAGQMTTAAGALRLEPGRHVSFEAGGSRTWVRLPNGRFIADLSHVRMTCAFTTRLAVFALAQFDGLAREVSANVRLNYTFRPGSDLFVVFNERRGSDHSVWDFEERAAVVKISYLTRF